MSKVYCDYFGFKQEPFSISPDPAFMYPSVLHRQALAHLKYGLEREGGFLLLTGEVGTGKTTLCRLLLEQIPASFRVAYLLNAKLDTREILESICDELGIEVPLDSRRSIKAHIDYIHRDLLAAHSAGRKTLLLIEEAQNLDPDVLEMLRLLTNLETNTTKLLHILLVGQPELLPLIARPELRQLNQRVVSRFHLKSLSLDEVERYVSHRLRCAGCPRPVFDTRALRALHRSAEGIPRMINQIAERALLGAYGMQRDKVSAGLVHSAAAEIRGFSPPAQARSWYARWSGFAVLLCLCGLGIGGYFGWLLLSDRAQPLLTPQSLERSQDWTASPATEAPPQTTAEFSASRDERFANSYQQLLARWGIESEQVSNQRGLCEVAAHASLTCELLLDAQLAQLESINRPALVQLSSQQDQTETLLVLRLDQQSVWVSNMAGESSLERAEFAQRWTGFMLYLWLQPDGYSEPLTVGASNPPLVEWWRANLLALDNSYPDLLSGGTYSQAWAQQVERFQRETGLVEDGILGQSTLMQLNQRLGLVPTIVPTGSGQAE